jgi:D-glycero-D-manno-heptose 1,7-bisphosphate phosphatase
MRSNVWPKTAVFLDRDDTLIRDRIYLSDPEEVELLPGAGEAVCMLNKLGIPAIVVTNQSGIARGRLDVETLDAIHARMKSLLSLEDAFLDAIYYCPHHPEGIIEEYRIVCSCRKPKPGLLLEAAGTFGLDLGLCYMVGDKPADIEVIHRVGGKGILVGKNRNQALRGDPDRTSDDILAAVHWVLEDLKR